VRSFAGHHRFNGFLLLWWRPTKLIPMNPAVVSSRNKNKGGGCMGSYAVHRSMKTSTSKPIAKPSPAITAPSALASPVDQSIRIGLKSIRAVTTLATPIAISEPEKIPNNQAEMIAASFTS